jgi:CTP synthase (UTP-ammonia lyase)
MAIHDDNTVISAVGFTKEIDEAGLTMVLDNLQVNQYQYPQKSTVREITSNAVDSVVEKNIAIAILTGKNKVEDFYLERDEAVYKSSNFDASYFDLNWLNTENDKVTIIYEEGDQVNTKDKIRFIDNGVGLGGDRLEGYFKLS